MVQEGSSRVGSVYRGDLQELRGFDGIMEETRGYLETRIESMMCLK